jgi:hypothetical protein
MKNLLFKLLACLLVILGAGMVPSFAESTVMPDVVAAEKARYSYMMTGTDGKLYNLYIIGDNEQFIGSSKAPWVHDRWDQLYLADRYIAYISENGGSAILQYNNLFGSRKDSRGEYANLSAPTYSGGVSLIKGVDGQPDILVTAEQLAASLVDYRLFVIKNGELKQMKFLYKSGKTRLEFIGDHKLPYELDDGTIAMPWFRRKTMEAKGGVFITIFMPDYTNMVLIDAYTYEDE